MSNSRRPKPNLTLGANTDATAMLRALGSTGSNPLPTVEMPPAIPLGHNSTVSQLLPGQNAKLPISLLVRSNLNARVYYNQAEVDETAQSMAVLKQQVPALGYVAGEKVVIVDGGKRLQACVAGKIDTLDVLIIEAPASPREEYELSRLVNDERSAQTPFDDAIRWREMLDQGIYDNQDSLASSLKISPSTVSKTMGLTRIPVHLQRMMAEHQQTRSLTIAYEVSNIFKDLTPQNQEQLETLAEEVIGAIAAKDLNRQQTIELINHRLNGPKTRLRGETTTVTFEGKKGAIKVVPERGELSFTIKGLPDAKLDELRALLTDSLSSQMSLRR